MLALALALTGCVSVTPDPDAIYVNEWPNGVTLTRDQLRSGRWKCWGSVLHCESAVGFEYDCRCVRN